MPNLLAQNVSWIGMFMVPLTDKASNSRSAYWTTAGGHKWFKTFQAPGFVLEQHPCRAAK
jgi:hypothetical protein